MTGNRPASRLARLRSRIARAELDALVVTHLTNVRYLTGFTGSSGAVVAGSDRPIFITDFRYRLQAAEEVRVCRLVEQKAGMVEALAGIIAARGFERVGVEGRHLPWAAYRELRRRLPRKVRLLSREGDVEALRAVKEAGEVARIRQAVRVAGLAFAKAARRLAGRREREVALGLERAMRDLGAEAPAFAPIVASGRQGAHPHARPGGRIIRRGEPVILDFGARCRGYHSDVTRTRLTGGGTSHRAREIYRVVLEAQEAAVAAVRPGVEARLVDGAARGVIATAGYGGCFGHGTGHGVGLDVHESPSISPRSGDILSPGMIFTLEPGIYVKNFGGVRIEDMVLVTPKGCEILTRSIVKESP